MADKTFPTVLPPLKAIDNGDGTYSVAVVIGGNAIPLPVRTTAQRDALTPASGWMIWNSTTTQAEIYNGATWVAVGSLSAAALIATHAALATVHQDASALAAALIATHSALGTGVHDLIKAIMTSTQTVNNTVTLVDVTELVLPLEANKNYILRAMLAMSADNNLPDWKVAWTVPAGCQMQWGPSNMRVVSNEAGDPYSLTSASITGACELWGTVRVGGTAGNLQLQFAQNTQTAVNTNFLAGSMLELIEA